VLHHVKSDRKFARFSGHQKGKNVAPFQGAGGGMVDTDPGVLPRAMILLRSARAGLRRTSVGRLSAAVATLLWRRRLGVPGIPPIC